MCQHFSCLPQAGGVLDQDPLIMELLMIVARARAEKEKAEVAKQQAKAKVRGR